MKFNTHYDLIGEHAFLGASKSFWVAYDENKLADAYRKSLAVERGIELHLYASMAIRLRIKQAKIARTLNMYINDAIGYLMVPEQPLFYSTNAFGTADAICFRDNILRVHDLKTGVTQVSMRQLEVYAALFCLEYGRKPKTTNIELRLYQADQAFVHIPEPRDIQEIMDKIVAYDKVLDKIKSEETEE